MANAPFKSLEFSASYIDSVSNPDQYEARLRQLERRIKQLEYSQRMLDVHVSAIERSIVFRILRRFGRPILDFKSRAEGWFARTPLSTISGRGSRAVDAYARFIESLPVERPVSPSPSASFCILLRLTEPRCDRLDETIRSICSQSHPFWELRIVDHATPRATSKTWLSDCLSAMAADPRIHLTRVEQSVDAASALNQAVASSACDYIILVDSGDLMDANALIWLASQSPAPIIYTDEDLLDANGRPYRPILKPDWSPDLLLACMYTGRLTAVSRQAWTQAGGFRASAEGVLDHDLLLRLTDGSLAVCHIPRILYHRRVSDGSATEGAIMAIRTSTARVVAETISRRGMNADVDLDAHNRNCCRVRWKPTQRILASLIICSRSPRLLKKCLSAIANKTAYDHREVVVVQHYDESRAELRSVIDAFSAVCVPFEGPFHFSRMNNLGAKAARGEAFVFLNDDIEPLDPSWLDRLIGQVERPDVGASGARLLYPSGTLQHAGVVIGISDGCGHIGRGAAGSQFWPWLNITRDVSAVTGACLAMRSALFHQLGGFSDEFPVNYNDVDLCLRIRRAGFRVVFDSNVILRHHECATRSGGVSFRERELWYERWAENIESGDPFYSPSLTDADESLSLWRSDERSDGSGGALKR